MATEEIRGIPFDSRLQIAEDGTQYEDREVFSADIAKYFGHISSDGICIPRGEALGDDLKVDPSTGGVITIHTGTIKIQGHIGWVEEQITRQLDAGGSKPRYDTVVIELNLNTAERRFIAKVVKGEEADEPIPPELTRTANVYQLGLADVYRVANSTVTGTITDTREDTTRCGVSQVNAPFGVLEISDGGTGADNAPEARQNINYIGVNPIASIDDDTTANWKSLGTGVAYINVAGLLNNQPHIYGFVENRVFANGYISQTFYALDDGTSKRNAVYQRSGNPSGWYDANWVKSLDENSGIQIKKLWENASPTSSFAKQTINLDMTGYDYIDVYVVRNKGTDASFQSSAYRLRLPVDTYLIFIEPPNINNVEYYARSITITSAKDKITFTSGVRRALNLSNLSTSTDEVVIPVEIYGIKGVV